MCAAVVIFTSVPGIGNTALLVLCAANAIGQSTDPCKYRGVSQMFHFGTHDIWRLANSPFAIEHTLVTLALGMPNLSIQKCSTLNRHLSSCALLMPRFRQGRF
jgi:hypothetical protein